LRVPAGFDIDVIRSRVAAYRPRAASDDDRRLWAATAFIVAPHGRDAHVAFIQRPTRAGDRWSGQMALPGGKRDPGDTTAVATAVRKAGEGIGWIFQMGMGYTFYLPFACYVAGLLLWSYTVSKLVLQGRPAGYGLALIFIAGYALQLSHLTLLVVLGLMLLTLDRRPAPSLVGDRDHRIIDRAMSLADARGYSH
jgi:hypothetical protein